MKHTQILLIHPIFLRDHIYGLTSSSTMVKYSNRFNIHSPVIAIYSRLFNGRRFLVIFQLFRDMAGFVSAVPTANELRKNVRGTSRM